MRETELPEDECLSEVKVDTHRLMACPKCVDKYRAKQYCPVCRKVRCGFPHLPQAQHGDPWPYGITD
jgi:hypothetical protein